MIFNTALVGIWYTGDGEEDTGNWCFEDGVITFQDIFWLYMENCRGKVLSIISDCNYSGQWVNECAKALDEMNIPSCGHHTREEGMLITIFTSCRSTEKATALAYLEESVYYGEGNKGVIHRFNKQLSSGQKSLFIDFRDIRCSRLPTESCEIDSTSTWGDRLSVYLVRDKGRVRQTRHSCLAGEDKIGTYQATLAVDSTDVHNI